MVGPFPRPAWGRCAPWRSSGVATSGFEPSPSPTRVFVYFDWDGRERGVAGAARRKKGSWEGVPARVLGCPGGDPAGEGAAVWLTSGVKPPQRTARVPASVFPAPFQRPHVEASPEACTTLPELAVGGSRQGQELGCGLDALSLGRGTGGPGPSGQWGREPLGQGASGGGQRGPPFRWNGRLVRNSGPEPLIGATVFALC